MSNPASGLLWIAAEENLVAGLIFLGVSAHTFRHTYAQFQLRAGLDLYSLSRLLGHESITITQTYLNGMRDKEILRQAQNTSPLMNI